MTIKHGGPVANWVLRIDVIAPCVCVCDSSTTPDSRCL